MKSVVARAVGGDLRGKRIAALGLAYKPDVDDLRESPAVEVVHLLQEGGASVRAYEPFRPDADIPGISLAPSLEDALSDADAILLLVGHTQFKTLSPETAAAAMSGRIAIDTVNGWDADAWERADFRLFRLGVNRRA